MMPCELASATGQCGMGPLGAASVDCVAAALLGAARAAQDKLCWRSSTQHMVAGLASRLVRQAFGCIFLQKRALPTLFAACYVEYGLGPTGP
jgi:hypothetical protein